MTPNGRWISICRESDMMQQVETIRSVQLRDNLSSGGLPAKVIQLDELKASFGRYQIGIEIVIDEFRERLLPLKFFQSGLDSSSIIRASQNRYIVAPRHLQRP